MRVAARLLRTVQMTKGNIAEGGGENSGCHGTKPADMDITFAFGRSRAVDREVAGGQERDAFCRSGSGFLVTGLYPINDLRTDVLCALTGPCRAQIPVAQKGQQGHENARIFRRGQRQETQGGIFAKVAGNMDIQGAKHLLGRLEQSGGIVVARNEDQGGTGALVECGNEIEVARLGRLRRVGGIENIAGHDNGIGGRLIGEFQQPREKAFVFLLAGLIVEEFAQVPVRRVDHTIGIGGFGRGGSH